MAQANNRIQLKRTSVSGRSPNTTNSGNTQYIAAGELALNITDGILYSSDGTNLITVGANVVNQKVTGTLTVNAISSNGTVGTAGQVLTSNGLTTYWSTVSASINTAAQYTFTNTHTYASALYINNNVGLNFKTVNTSASASFIQQSDDNFVFYTTSTSYGQRPVFSIFANSATSTLSMSAPVLFNANLIAGAISANGSLGSAGQLLASNGSSTYWVSPGAASVNTAAQFSWTNTHTFSANVSFTGNGIGISSNTGAVYLGGISDANWKIGRNTNATTKWKYTNNTIDIVTASSNLEGMTIGLVGGNSYFETGYLGTFIASNVTIGNSSVNSTINSTSFSGNANTATTANLATYIIANNGISSNSSGVFAVAGIGTSVNSIGINVVANNGLTATVSGVFVNANNGLIVNSTGVHVLANSGIVANSTGTFVNTAYIATISANNASYLGGVAASGYQTTAGLSANVATLAANSATYLGDANNYGNSTGVYTSGIISVGNSSVFVGANSSSFYGNSAGGYNNPAFFIPYKGDTYWSYGGFSNNTNVWLQTRFYGDGTANKGFRVLDASTNNVVLSIDSTGTLKIANTSTINATIFSGTSNNSLYLGGTIASGYQTTAGLSANVATLTANNTSFVGTVSAANVVSNAQLSSNLSNYQTTAGLTANIAAYLPTYTGVVNASSIAIGNGSINVAINSTSIAVNGSVGTNGQVLTSNGSTTYWANSSGGGSVNTDSQYTFSNAITFSNTITVAAISANGGVGTANQVLYSNGSSTYWGPSGTSGIVSQQFTANGSQTSFTVSGGYAPNQIGVWVNGVKQVPITDVLINSGSVITLINTPSNGSVVDVYGVTSVNYAASNTYVSATSIAYTANGSQTSFILPGTVYNPADLFVLWNGQVALPTVDYTISGSYVNTTFTPSNGDTVELRLLGSTGYGGVSSGIGNTYVSGTSNTFTANGSTSTFVTNISGITANADVIVTRNGLLMVPTTHYSASGNTIVFNSMPYSGDVIEVRKLNASSYGVNTVASYVWTNTHSYNANVSFAAAISANGTVGTSGQVLTSNGSVAYWSTISTNTFTTAVSANGSTGTSGQVLTTAGSGSNAYWSTISTNTFTTAIAANGSTGTAGQMLTSAGSGSNAYWSTPPSGVTTGKSIAMAIVFGG